MMSNIVRCIGVQLSTSQFNSQCCLFISTDLITPYIKGTHMKFTPSFSSLSACSKSYNKTYLNRMLSITNNALEEHSATFAVRVDLHLPVASVEGDGITCLPNLSPGLLSRFADSIKAQIEHYRGVRIKRGERVHPCKSRYFWVREQDSAVNPHYHVALFFNKDLFWKLGDFNASENNLCNMIRKAWLSALELSEYDEYHRLVHFPDNGTYVLNTRSPDFPKQYDSFVYRIKYLAKEETKQIDPKVRSFGGSLR